MPNCQILLGYRMSEKQHHIYLMGNISGDDRTYLWREIVTDLFKHDPIVIQNPCDNAFNRRMRELHRQLPCPERDAAIEALYESAQRTLRPKDYVMIRISSLAIWNTTYDNPERPSLASPVEHTWCVDIFGIPVIMIAQPDSPFLNHSWFAQYCAAIVEDVEDAVHHVREFFL